MKSWILRILLLAAWLPALGLVGAVAVWGLVEQKSEGALALVRNLLPADVLLEPQNYRLTAWTLAYSYFFKVEMFFIMLLVAFVGPSLISRDLRFNALPLYLARPMTRLDYFLGKLGVIGAVVALAVVGPAVLAYVIGVCFSLNLSVVKDTYSVLLCSVAFGLVITLSIGTFVLALSSLTRRSLYVGIAWAGMWIISGSVGSIMTAIHQESMRHELTQEHIDTWLIEHPMPPGVQMHNGYPQARWNPEEQKMQLVGVASEHAEEAERWYQEYLQANGRSRSAAEERLGKAMRSDWRPMCSYVANLNRIGDRLLNTDAAWVQLGRALQAPRAAFAALGGGRSKAPPVNERILADRMVAQYPWEWSAAVLAALLNMDPVAAREVAGPVEVTPTIEFDGVSKWYGNVIGLNKLTLRLSTGVTGLLGPNGAGKSTLLQLATGQLRPSQGSVRILGQPAWNNPALMRHIGLCPEQDAFYEWMTGFDFVRTCARLTGLGRRAACAAAEQVLATTGMTEHMHRAIRGYSKGMRQRTKLAQALVHEPRVLFLDEPFTGTDPVGRHEMIQVIRKVGAAGRTVVVSSHVLHEVQALTPNIVLLHRGRLVAEGHVRQIRDLIDGHPHRIVLVCNDFRALAARVVGWDDVESVKVMSGQGALMVETRQPDAFYGRLPALAVENGTVIREVYSEDDNLEAVFKYLVSR